VFYGVIGNPNSRYYNRAISESITLTGRILIQKLASLFEEMGYKAVYGDTDSTFVVCNPDDELLNKINTSIETWVKENYKVPDEYYCLRAEMKNLFSKIYFPPGAEKKRYVGIVNGERKVVGFEIKRHNVPKIVAIIQGKIFDIIMSNGSTSDINKMLKEEHFKLINGNYDKELIIESGTKSSIDEYENPNVPQARASKKAMEAGAFRPGETIQYVIVDVGRKGMEVEPIIDGKMPEITGRAREYYWRHRVMPMVDRLVELEKQKSLSDYI